MGVYVDPVGFAVAVDGVDLQVAPVPIECDAGAGEGVACALGASVQPGRGVGHVGSGLSAVAVEPDDPPAAVGAGRTEGQGAGAVGGQAVASATCEVGRHRSVRRSSRRCSRRRRLGWMGGRRLL